MYLDIWFLCWTFSFSSQNRLIKGHYSVFTGQIAHDWRFGFAFGWY